MSQQDPTRPASSTTAPNAPPVDAAGKPVNVIERDLEDQDNEAHAVDQTLTPSSNRTKEQEVEELQRKTDEIERKVADGN